MGKKNNFKGSAVNFGPTSEILDFTDDSWSYKGNPPVYPIQTDGYSYDVKDENGNDKNAISLGLMGMIIVVFNAQSPKIKETDVSPVFKQVIATRSWNAATDKQINFFAQTAIKKLKTSQTSSDVFELASYAPLEIKRSLLKKLFIIARYRITPEYKEEGERRIVEDIVPGIFEAPDYELALLTGLIVAPKEEHEDHAVQLNPLITDKVPAEKSEEAASEQETAEIEEEQPEENEPAEPVENTSEEPANIPVDSQSQNVNAEDQLHERLNQLKKQPISAKAKESGKKQNVQKNNRKSQKASDFSKVKAAKKEEPYVPFSDMETENQGNDSSAVQKSESSYVPFSDMETSENLGNSEAGSQFSPSEIGLDDLNPVTPAPDLTDKFVKPVPPSFENFNMPVPPVPTEQPAAPSLGPEVKKPQFPTNPAEINYRGQNVNSYQQPSAPQFQQNGSTGGMVPNYIPNPNIPQPPLGQSQNSQQRPQNAQSSFGPYQNGINYPSGYSQNAPANGTGYNQNPDKQRFQQPSAPSFQQNNPAQGGQYGYPQSNVRNMPYGQNPNAQQFQQPFPQQVSPNTGNQNMQSPYNGRYPAGYQQNNSYSQSPNSQQFQQANRQQQIPPNNQAPFGWNPNGTPWAPNDPRWQQKKQ